MVLGTIKIRAVLFDLIGTTVIEKDRSITKCFADAFEANGVLINNEHVRKNRGKDKIDIIKNILSEINYPSDISEAILRDYKINLENRIEDFVENGHLREIMSYLKENEIKAGVGTGLSRDFLDKLIKHLKWESIGFDYTGTSEETGIGRPNPGMIFDMMKKLGIKQNEILKVGDTVADIREGKNARVLTAAILSGTQSNDDLINEKPDFIINSLKEIKDIVKQLEHS